MGKIIIKALLWKYNRQTVDLTWKVNGCFVGTAYLRQPYLQSEKIIHCTDDYVDGGGAANLSPQVVLKIYSTESF